MIEAAIRLSSGLGRTLAGDAVGHATLQQDEEEHAPLLPPSLLAGTERATLPSGLSIPLVAPRNLTALRAVAQVHVPVPPWEFDSQEVPFFVAIPQVAPHQDTWSTPAFVAFPVNRSILRLSSPVFQRLLQESPGGRELLIAEYTSPSTAQQVLASMYAHAPQSNFENAVEHKALARAWYLGTHSAPLPNFTSLLPDLIQACDLIIDGRLTDETCGGLLQRGLAVNEPDTVAAVLAFATQHPESRSILHGIDEASFGELLKHPSLEISEDERLNLLEARARHQTNSEEEARAMLGRMHDLIDWAKVNPVLRLQAGSEGWVSDRQLRLAAMESARSSAAVQTALAAAAPTVANPSLMQPFDIEAGNGDLAIAAAAPWSSARIIGHSTVYALGNSAANGLSLGLFSLAIGVNCMLSARLHGGPTPHIWRPVFHATGLGATLGAIESAGSGLYMARQGTSAAEALVRLCMQSSVNAAAGVPSLVLVGLGAGIGAAIGLLLDELLTSGRGATGYCAFIGSIVGVIGGGALGLTLKVFSFAAFGGEFQGAPAQ